MKQQLNEIKRMQQLAGILNENSLQQYVSNKAFMKSFIANAEESHKLFGDFKSMYDVYEGELTEKEISNLLQYCDKNDLISY